MSRSHVGEWKTTRWAIARMYRRQLCSGSWSLGKSVGLILEEWRVSDATAEYISYHLLARYGPSGVGRSTVIHRIASRLRAEEPNPSCTPVVIVQASPEDVGSSARLDFYRRVLHALRGHVAIGDRIKNLPLARLRGRKRRMRDEHFAHYHFTQKEECENFIEELKALLLQVPL